MEQIILSGITIERFTELIATAVKKELSSTKDTNGKLNIKAKKEDTLLTRKDVAKLLKISLPTLHEWTKAGLLFSYRIGSRILYKFDEVEQAIAQRNFTKFSRAPNNP